ncbi:hypothetical protein ACVMIH_006687 [Bradyrhizobium sp. USDA 4503]|nr:hypothetical protein [Bradyrhizobium sp. USDA 4545]MCP1920968.1 hypothetical protein [Bradyrhizobium sp. USDA 4532]
MATLSRFQSKCAFVVMTMLSELTRIIVRCDWRWIETGSVRL